MNRPRYYRTGLPSLVRILMEKRLGFRYPIIVLLGLACACSFALTIVWRQSGPRDGAFMLEFYAEGHGQGVNQEVYAHGEAQEMNETAHKYFQEAGPHQPGDDEQLGHYDIRFFKGKLKEEEKGDIQVHMVRAYLDTFRRLDLVTWIAHGTLLGWWWNQSLLPWDWDVDAQVSESALFDMANKFNNTLHKYKTTVQKDQQPTTTTYLLDVNPHCIIRSRGDGLNIIDARWINMDNGLYIDITGLSELHPEEHPGVVSCKNQHEYKVTNLYPLQDTKYEGVAAKVPAACSTLLVEEYGQKSLIVEEYEGHKWDPSKRVWTKMSNSTKLEE